MRKRWAMFLAAALTQAMHYNMIATHIFLVCDEVHLSFWLVNHFVCSIISPLTFVLGTSCRSSPAMQGAP